ncbi:hypothetical protein Q5X42_04955 [Acinetobacter baumannii]|uniref:hypothetical protein n=1 Tax=Acinetobacter baumannii TaxID=470 RepID=UPI0002CF670B|nr:hypothetical protein [Acinetobacter baumannii]ENW64837.1 hypothetical protein F914_00736 [Acinetobacter baumannii NIPH 290]MDO7393277.1 hypothetical protein [Acinetobacter baumannii]HDX6144230.1 hypothetical protein [Acinetobacter baumannii]
MDNYKIKVKDEAESKEAQELFFELGYEWFHHGKSYIPIGRDCTHLTVYSDGLLAMGIGDAKKELTLPQLRDLVVLKRNDVRDANYRSINVSDGLYFKSCDGKFYFMFEGVWVLSENHTDEGLEPITKAQGLISGAEALANVHKHIVQYLHDDEPYGRWTTITDHRWSQYHLGMFLDPETKFKFRLKPQIIKVELEIPAPFEPEEDCHVYILDDGKTDGYRRYFYEVHGDKGNEFIGIWKTEDEIKQVVAQLRKIRGTNS